jgi:glycosyltransferase involved in cell wall biosynthesis
MENIITFIIPSINRSTIVNSIESLKNQTNPNWKCIIVYDGVDGMQFDDERITTIKTEKKGIEGINNHVAGIGVCGLVRNEGLKLCNTEWIGFLDDDDTIHPNYVEKLFESYTKYDLVVWRMKYENGFILPEFDRTDLVFGRVGISFCYKNKFNDLLFDNDLDGDDFGFLSKLIKLTDNWIITDEVYYNVRH